MMRSVSAVSPVSSVVCEVGDSTAMVDGATELSLAGVAEGSCASASQIETEDARDDCETQPGIGRFPHSDPLCFPGFP